MDIIITSLSTAILTGLVTGGTLFLLLRPAPKKRSRKQSKKAARAQAMNAVALAENSLEDMKIKSAEIEIPIIAEDVLTYEPGELGEAYPERVRLYYPADAIKDTDYIKTVRHSAMQMETHQKNTGEYNRSIDGWPFEVWWDDTEKRVKAKGIIHGENNVEYAERNKNLPGFGVSAYISFPEIDRTPGTAPNGKPYDAIVRKAVNQHIAILPNIRDRNNVIVALNASEPIETRVVIMAMNNSGEAAKKIDGAETTWAPDSETWSQAQNALTAGDRSGFQEAIAHLYNSLGPAADGRNKMPIDKDEFRSAMNEYEADKKAEDEKAEKIKNAIKNELKEESSQPVTSTETGKNAETSSGGNAAETSSTERADASNAIAPSDDMVKDFATHLGVTIRNPTLEGLAGLVGIKATEPAELISALNAKREEFKSQKPTAPEAVNSQVSSLADALAQF